MSGARATWIDGAAGDSLPADDRGLSYGDGLFETIRIRNGRARFLQAHLARLELGCQRLQIPFNAWRELQADIDRAVALEANGLLKLLVTRGSATRRGYAVDGGEVPRRVVSVWSAPAAPPAEGVDTEIAQTRLGDQPALAGIKHLNRLEQVLAAGEARAAQVFDVLLRGPDGRLVCGGLSNLFLVSRGTVVTPLIDRAGVAGVMRGIVLRECASLGIVASERVLQPEDLTSAEAAFLTNVRIGVVPVRRVGEHRYPMSSLVQRIATHIEALDA